MSGPERFKRFERQGWDARAESYGSLTGDLTRRLAGPLLDAAALRAGDRLLDVAAGPGYVAAEALARGADPIGIDISARMVSLAARENPGIEFMVADAEEPPFGEASFEVVAANFAINHLPSPPRAAAALARLLRPGGRFAFSVWDPDERNPIYRIAAESIEAVGGGVPDPVPAGGPDPTRYSDAAEAEALLAGAGLGGFEMRHVEIRWPVASGEALWAALLAGSVRTASRIRARDAEAQRRIREEFTARAEAELRRGNSLAVPASVRIASAAKPG